MAAFRPAAHVLVANHHLRTSSVDTDLRGDVLIRQDLLLSNKFIALSQSHAFDLSAFRHDEGVNTILAEMS